MSTIHDATELGRTAASGVDLYRSPGKYWAAFLEWRERRRLQTVLYGLSDLELRDIGITRGEIDFVTINRSTDFRGETA